MRTYSEHLARADTSELVSYAGGRARRIVWTLEERDVVGRIYGTEVVRANPDGVTITTAGHNLPSTVEALATGAGIGLHNRGGELFYRSERVTDGMRLDYSGRVLEHGAELAPVRGADAARAGSSVTVVVSGTSGRHVAETAARRLLEPGETLERNGTLGALHTFRVR